MQTQPANLCGVGISFTKVTSGEIKITGVMPGSPAHQCEAVQIGDVLLKVDGQSVMDRTQEQIINMVLGPPESSVSLTIQSQYGYPHVMTAPFQVLPFDNRRHKKNKGYTKKSETDGENSFISPQNRLYGGGTLPKGFEHLESLRSAQPYTTPSLSVRTVHLQRQLPAPSHPKPMESVHRPMPEEQGAARVQQSPQQHQELQFMQQQQVSPAGHPGGTYHHQSISPDPMHFPLHRPLPAEAARSNPAPQQAPVGLPAGYTMMANQSPGIRTNVSCSGAHLIF
jgi:hypothetical protein